MAPVTPGTRTDTSPVNIGMTVLRWALDSIMDLPSRHDAWLHVANSCKREADRVVEQMKHQARLDLPKPEPKRPPSGHFAAVTELLAKSDSADEEKT